MIPVYQDKFGKGGSCFTACIASILELPIKTLPNFVEFGDKWMLELWAFLKPMGLSYTTISYRKHEPLERIPIGYHTISGYAPRGFSHSVVGFRGQFIHDPFPNGGGLITVNSWGVIHNIDSESWEEWTVPFEAKL